METPALRRAIVVLGAVLAGLALGFVLGWAAAIGAQFVLPEQDTPPDYVLWTTPVLGLVGLAVGLRRSAGR